jgi:hypothetical protein
MRVAAELFGRHRRWLARVILLLGAAYAAIDLWPRFPHETQVELALGPRHGEVVELRLAYLDAGEELAGVSFGFPEGAPATVRHRVKLPAGRFELRCELRGRSGDSRSIVRELQTPASGAVRFELGDQAGNMRSANAPRDAARRDSLRPWPSNYGAPRSGGSG